MSAHQGQRVDAFPCQELRTAARGQACDLFVRIQGPWREQREKEIYERLGIIESQAPHFSHSPPLSTVVLRAAIRRPDELLLTSRLPSAHEDSSKPRKRPMLAMRLLTKDAFCQECLMPDDQSNSPEFRQFASKWRLMRRLLGLPLLTAVLAHPDTDQAAVNEYRLRREQVRAIVKEFSKSLPRLNGRIIQLYWIEGVTVKEITSLGTNGRISKKNPISRQVLGCL